MNRTQIEIKERFDAADDFMGTQKGDIIDFMEFETAKEFLKKEYVEKVGSGEEVWKVVDNAKEKILDYLDFAYGKAEDERGLSAGRSMMHFKTWIWIDDADFYNEVIPLIDDYTEYGIPALDEISKHYGYIR